MKFAFIALIAAVTAADPAGGGSTTGGGASDDSWKWAVCLKATDCKDGWVCCGTTKDAEGKTTTKEMICTDPT